MIIENWLNEYSITPRIREREVKNCSIIVKNGKYYACFSCEAEAQLKLDTKLTSLDKGLKLF